MMVILGTLDAIWGLAGIVNDEIVVVGGTGALIIDITAWGWIHLILGIVVVLLAGSGILPRNMLARTVGVLVAALSAILNFMWLPYHPAWAFSPSPSTSR
jgi:hypothetical protein